MLTSDMVLAPYIATVLAVAVLSVMSRTAVRRTRMHYLGKTYLIVMVILHILLLLLYTVIVIRETDVVTEQIFYVVYAIVMGSLFAKAVIDMLKNDDDDWFNDQLKKFKSWMKKRRSVRKIKAAPAS